MSDRSSERKKQVLGMPFGTATHRLRKAIMFDMAKRLGLHICYRCKQGIENIDHFTIEHKEAWEKSDDPVGLYFDLQNIGFSHHKCNVGASLKTNKILTSTRKERKQDHDRKTHADRMKKRDEWRRRCQAQGLPYT